MKMRSISFDVTIGSVWANGDRYHPEISEPSLPVGGIWQTGVEIEFEPKDGDVMKEAFDALGTYMANNYPGETYHIWYWTWLN